MTEPILTLIDEGDLVEHRGKRSYTKRTIRVNRVWRVELDGAVIGYVRYRLLTREQKIPGKRYVASRWQTPGWEYVHGDHRFKPRWLEGWTKKYCVEQLVREARS